MCGVGGYVGPKQAGVLDAMIAALHHRGPDENGIYESDNLHLSHTRLSIIDLNQGQQPMANKPGDVVVAYNGEIFNYREIRQRMIDQGHSFQTNSDTEVLLHLYEEYGDDFAKHLEGMFACALWDNKNKKLLLVRDQVGIKPMHYYWDGTTLVFGSEIKAILCHPAVTAKRTVSGTHYLLNLRYIPAPESLFENIKKVRPGHMVVFKNNQPEEQRYWQWDHSADNSLSKQDWVDRFREQMTTAVKRHMLSDVPVGAYLSGGIDSSTIAHYAQQNTKDPLRTYCLGFGEDTDENEDAKMIAQHLGTQHQDQVLPSDALKIFPKVIYHAEEPKINCLQGFFLSGFVSQHVKVALSGMGGDELFAGYDLHRQMNTFLNLRSAVPKIFRGLAGAPLGPLSRILDHSIGAPFENFRRGMEMVSHMNRPDTAYRILRNAWDLDDYAKSKVYNAAFAKQVDVSTENIVQPYFSKSGDDLRETLWADFNLKMVDDYLQNEDRMSMAHSLELRVPFLDRSLVESFLRLPRQFYFADDHGKLILREAMRDILPNQTIEKKKWGFTFNPYQFFQRELGSKCREVLTPEVIEEQGVFNQKFIHEILHRKPTKLMHWHYYMIWMALGLHYWDEIFIHRRPVEDIA